MHVEDVVFIRKKSQCSVCAWEEVSEAERDCRSTLGLACLDLGGVGKLD